MSSRLWGEPASGDPFTDRRRTGIGGSDSGAVLGISPYASPLSVWESKRGLAPLSEPSEWMVWGSRLERAVRDGYAEDTGKTVRHVGFRRHKDVGYVIGHPDGATEDRLLEVKVTGFLSQAWGPPGSDQIPPHYMSQVQHYMFLTGTDLCDLVALVGARKADIWTIPADRSFADEMVREEGELWRRVEQDDPPPPDGSEASRDVIRRLFPRAETESIVATPEVSAYVIEYERAKERLRLEEKTADRYQQLVQAFMGSRERLVGEGYTANWSNVAGRTDWKAVAAKYGDLLDRIDAELPEGVGYQTLEALTARDAIVEQTRGESSRRFSISRKEDR